MQGGMLAWIDGTYNNDITDVVATEPMHRGVALILEWDYELSCLCVASCNIMDPTVTGTLIEVGKLLVIPVNRLQLVPVQEGERTNDNSSRIIRPH